MSKKGDLLQISTDRKGSTVILHELKQVHIISTDLGNDEEDPDGLPSFQAVIKLKKQYRSLFFRTFQEMHNAIEFILTCQNYSSNRFD